MEKKFSGFRDKIILGNETKNTEWNSNLYDSHLLIEIIIIYYQIRLIKNRPGKSKKSIIRNIFVIDDLTFRWILFRLDSWQDRECFLYEWDYKLNIKNKKKYVYNETIWQFFLNI